MTKQGENENMSNSTGGSLWGMFENNAPLTLPNASASCTCTCRTEIQELRKELKEQRQILLNIDSFVRMLIDDKKRKRHDDVRSDAMMQLGPPAATEVELANLLENSTLTYALAGYQCSDLGGTLRKMMQRLMKKDLAIQFSFTGLGLKRQPENIKFNGHPAHLVIHEAIKRTIFKDVPTREIDCGLMKVLRRAVDWSGSARKRKKRKSNSPLTSSETVSRDEVGVDQTAVIDPEPIIFVESDYSTTIKPDPSLIIEPEDSFFVEPYHPLTIEPN